MREDERVQGFENFIEGYWWLIFIIPAVAGGQLQRHHRRRLAIIAAKAELAEKKNAGLQPPPEPQAICGCTHHLSFHNPRTSACAVDDCRCQQYVGPEPLGHVFAQPLIDPDGIDSPQHDQQSIAQDTDGTGNTGITPDAGHHQSVPRSG
jgi:hypothetical protein